MQRHYVAGLLLGAYPRPSAEDVGQVEDPQLATVMDSIALVADWSPSWPVGADDVADTLLVVHGEPSPYRLLGDLLADWDRVEDRVRELLPLAVLLREFEAAADEQAAAADAVFAAIDRHEKAKEALDALHAIAATVPEAA